MAKPIYVSEDTYRKWERSLEKMSSFFALGSKCKQYVAGRQWTEEEKEVLRKRNQPAIVYNQIAPVRRFVISLFDALKRVVTVLPRSGDDNEKAWMMAQVIDYVFDINDVETKRLWVARDAFDVGIGWWCAQRNQIITADPVEVDYVSWNEMIWDSSAKRMDLSDAQYMARVKWASVDAVKEAFPEYRKQIDEAIHQDMWMPDWMYVDPKMVNEEDRTVGPSIGAWYDRTLDRVQLMEWWEYKFERLPCIISGDVLIPFDEELHSSLIAAGEQLVEAPVRVPYMSIICGPFVLYESRTPYKHFNFPYVPVVFDWDDERYEPRGMVADLIDPQDEVNKRRSKAIHFLNMNQVVMDEGAVPDVDALREELADPEGVIVKRPNRSFELLRNLELAKGHLELMMDAINEIRLISGIYSDAIGQPTNARTGAAIQARREGTQTSLVLFLKSAMNAEKKLAIEVMDLIKQYYRGPRILRITDAKGQAAFLSINQPKVDPTTGQVVVENSLQNLQADLVVSFRAPFSSERQYMATHITEILKVAPPQLQAPLMNLWLDFLDVPSKDEIRQQINQSAEQAAIMSAQQGQVQGGSFPQVPATRQNLTPAQR